MTLRLLIAEDSATNRALNAIVCRRMGYHADIAASGAEALELYKKNIYDLIFVDISMPVMSGVELAAAINRANPRNTPVYAVSGHDPEAWQEKLERAGVKKCLPKPLDAHTILAAAAESGIAAALEPQGETAPMPRHLLGTYARELRSRGHACENFYTHRAYADLRREAHTLKALARMLKTPTIENHAADIESLCRTTSPPPEAEQEERIAHAVAELATTCAATAEQIEKTIREMPQEET